MIDLVQFADDTAIDPMYVDKAYYLAPDGADGRRRVAVMRDGMKGKAGIGKLAHPRPRVPGGREAAQAGAW